MSKTLGSLKFNEYLELVKFIDDSLNNGDDYFDSIIKRAENTVDFLVDNLNINQEASYSLINSRIRFKSSYIPLLRMPVSRSEKYYDDKKIYNSTDELIRENPANDVNFYNDSVSIISFDMLSKSIICLTYDMEWVDHRGGSFILSNENETIHEASQWEMDMYLRSMKL